MPLFGPVVECGRKGVKTMRMIPVDSSNLSAVGHDPVSQILRISFNSGGTYDYFDVPMAAAVARYTQTQHGRDCATALEKISIVRTKETGMLAERLDALYNAVSIRSSYSTLDFKLINQCLTEVINEKRRRKGDHKAPGSDSPS